MPFRIALSGLNAAQTDLSVTANNIANTSTNGFKGSRAEFADLFAVSLQGVSSNATGNGVRVAADQEYARKCSLLLRIARAINLGRSGAVQQVGIQTRNGVVRLQLRTRRRMGADLEIWAIEKDRGYFREVFGRELSVAAL